ncbi:MAG TPA: hypothetical protein VLA20_02415 [Vicinamibacterales bacterium]|nr:hypothetical protein [Vicinamibacterales bacterium]
MKRLVGIGLCWVFAAALQDGPRVSFGLTTQAVVLNVAVLDGNAAVAGLGLDDFEVFDNGVRQTLEAVDNAALPIDLRLVFDISGSISEEDLTSYLRAMEQVTSALEPADRCEIITFWSRIADAASRQSPPVTIALPRGGPFGTAFFDAASLAMVTVPTPDRRQVTIILSDARDNASFSDEATLVDMARRTDAVVYTVLPMASSATLPVSVDRLQALALLTGGRLVRTHERQVGPVIIDALRDFRQTYLLYYQVTGVELDGWHEVQVKVRRRGPVTVRTRAGYFSR